uniref:Ubiquitin-like protease family profile domain-containing protein n=1 Tax=Ditylenchus dipsaci TaxID=166011 RepID=A0A915DCT2_9BILA
MMPDTLEFLAIASHLLATAEKKESKIARRKQFEEVFSRCENTANAMHDTSMMPDTLEFLAIASHLLATAEKKESKIAQKKAIRRSLQQMRRVIKKIYQNPLDASLNDNEVVLCKFNIAVTKEDMSRLCPGKMLNDNLINFYLELIADRSKHDDVLPQVSVFHTQFYEKLSSEGVSSVKKWTKTMDIFLSDLLLIPIHHASHWSLVVVKVSKQRLVYYDSLHGDGSKYLSQIKEFLRVESARKGYKGLDAKLAGLNGQENCDARERL